MSTLRRHIKRVAPGLAAFVGQLRALPTLRSRTIFIRRVLARRLLSKLDRFPERLGNPALVIFVCRGNIMRSALAEAIVRARLKEGTTVSVTSAGINAKPGTGADPRAAAYARTLGLSLADHRAQAFDYALVSRADLIVALDHGIEAEILARAPSGHDRVVLLGGVDLGGVYRGTDIPDPYAADEPEATRLFKAVERDALQLATWLQARRPAAATEGGESGR